MHFEGEFRVPGTPDVVMHHFTDVERMARCVPGAVIEGRGEDGSYLGVMVVSFGPKKVKFRGRVAHQTDPATLSGTLTGRGAADMRAARIGVRVTYAVRADGQGSVVSLVSDADLGGVLADFARTGGIPVANALMADFAKRVAAEFAEGAETSAPAGAPPTPIAAHWLLWEIVKAKLVQLARSLGLAART